MIEVILLAVPGYLAIGLLVFGWALFTTPRAVRPEGIDLLSVLLVAMVCWPRLVWAMFRGEDE